MTCDALAENGSLNGFLLLLVVVVVAVVVAVVVVVVAILDGNNRNYQGNFQWQQPSFVAIFDGNSSNYQQQKLPTAAITNSNYQQQQLPWQQQQLPTAIGWWSFSARASDYLLL